jgi:hypothetical protein
MTDTTPDAIRARRLVARDWHGYLTFDNASHVFGRILSMLERRRYTWVAVNTAMTRATPDMRTGQHLDPSGSMGGKSGDLTFAKLEDGRPWAHMMFHDTYGVWGIDTTYRTEAEARQAERDGAKNVTYVDIDGDGTGRNDKIEIRQYNGYGEQLIWLVMPEPEPDRDLVLAYYAVEAGFDWFETDHPEVVRQADHALAAVKGMWADYTGRH